MRVTNYPNKALFDRRFKEVRNDPSTLVDFLPNPVKSFAEVAAVWDREGHLVEMFRWTDLT